MTWLIADIGGTHARFAQCEQGHRHHALETLSTADFDDLESAVAHYVRQQGQGVPRLQRLMLALPCPVEQDPIVLTNAGWRIQRHQVRERLGLERLEVVNDFHAQAMALPFLDPEDLVSLGPVAANAPLQGNRVVLGPGTGLGVAALVDHPDHPMPVTGEGGHVTLSAANEYEDELLRVGRRRLGHVSAEKFVSGIGLSELEHCMALVDGDASYQTRDTRAIVNAAIAGESRAQASVAQMIAFLATVSADLALTFSAFGGVYFSGGILPRLREVVDWPAFHRRFLEKGRFQSYLERIPTYLITHQQPGLLGLAAMIRDVEQA